MNTTLKHWKEAATLILAAGTKRSTGGGGGGGAVDLLRGSARSPWDHCLLLLKRSSRSGFMPNAYVFPGGVVDASDFSSEWLGVFRAFAHRQPNLGLGVVKQPADTRPSMFTTDRRALGSPVPGDVAFRICALRETFEECGVLLVVAKADEGSVLTSGRRPLPAGPPRVTDPCDPAELTRWRALVNENPANFLKMCQSLQLLPNIWALHEWGNWLTPTAGYGTRRYDTAFYLCCLPDLPLTVQDDKEIVHVKWATPPEVLHSYRAGEIWIAPPQFYELSRLCNYTSLQELHAFASRRAEEGCERWLPVILKTDTHHISLLPGDKLYPATGSSTNAQEPTTDPGLGLGAEGVEPGLHRLVLQDPYSASIQISITPKYKHLPPLPVPDHNEPSDPNDPSDLKQNIKSHL